MYVSAVLLGNVRRSPTWKVHDGWGSTWTAEPAKPTPLAKPTLGRVHSPDDPMQPVCLSVCRAGRIRTGGLRDPNAAR